MIIHLIEKKATFAQMREMMQSLESYVKLAVDVEKKILAGGGALHADCESVLLENGSSQKDVWGADWIPVLNVVTYESLINIRPGQQNYSMELADSDLRKKIEQIVRDLLEGVNHEEH